MIGLIFLLILVGYAGFHYYLYRKIIAAFKPGWVTRLVLALSFQFLIAAPFISRYLDHDGHPALSRTINLPVFLWIAWLFWFFMAGILMDLWNIIIRLLPGINTNPARFAIPPRKQFLSLCVMIILATGWSVIEGSTPRIQTIPLGHPAVPPGHSIRIVQVSDVHLGMMRSSEWNRTLCRTIETLKPDILISTGDMVDTSMKNIGDQTEAWAAIQPPLGKFAVLGNHEYYLGLGESLAFHKRSGFKLLRGETADITKYLRISGVDDKEGNRLNLPCYNDESALIPVPDRTRFSILLKHQPTVLRDSVVCFNLQLSGHTHNGQLFPFHLFLHLFYPYTHGLYHIRRDFNLYVSSGTGTWGPPLRLFAPPEITVFELHWERKQE